MLHKFILAAAMMGAVTAGAAGAAYAGGTQCGTASWYALHSRTASGAMMNPAAMTAAHRTLPFGTKVKVVSKHSGRTIYVTINDRGPFVKGRIIDLSRAAARKLGIDGLGQVCIASR